MQQLTEVLVASLAGQEKHVRALIPFAVSVFQEHHLYRNGHVPQRLLVDNALSVYSEAATFYELEVLQKSLWAMYEYYAQYQPALLPPSQCLPVKSPTPFWNTNNSPLSFCEQLLAVAEIGVKHPDPPICVISMLLLLARHTGVSSSARLKALLQCDTLIVLQDANRAIYHDEKGGIFLDAMALLLLRRLQQLPNLIRILAQIGKHFNDWLNAFPSLIDSKHLQGALNTIVFLDSPVCANFLTETTKPLSQDLMVGALTGHVQRSAESGTRIKSRVRMSRVPFIAIDENNSASRLAIGSAEYDLSALRQLNFALEKFRHDEPKGHRNSAAFKMTKNTLQTLEHDCQNRCSIIVNIIVCYCVNLFLTGSAWKSELAASTVKQYASTLKVFAEECWSDNTLLIGAQSSAESLFALTEQVVEAFDNTLAADRQNTLSIFCQFIQQRVPIKFFDETGLEYIGAGSTNTRTHYIAPQLFEAALTKFMATSSSPHNQQTFWFLRLCYYLGLRHTEAADLHVVDVTDRWIYVTRRQRRKSRSAIRRVSLCFMPSSVCQAFLQWISTRRRSSIYLFDAPVIDYSLILALQILRERSGITDLVVHSLRHCAANNITWLLAMAAFERQDWRDRYYFCRAPLFDDENIMRLHTMFASFGRRLASHTPTLEFAASQLGHCSPSVTAASYLHLFDLWCWELSFVRVQTPLRGNVLPFLSDNNHRFSVWPICDPYNETALFRHATHGLQGAQRMKIAVAVHGASMKESVTSKLSFSEYVNYLVEYHTLPSAEIDERLKQHLFQSYRGVDLSNLYSISHTPAWIQLLGRINSIKWTRPNSNAIETMHRLIEHGSVRDIRTLRHVLQAFMLLRFQQKSLVFKCPSDQCLSHTWRALAERYQLPIEEVKHQEKFTELNLHFLKKPTATALRFQFALMLTNNYIKFLRG